MNQAAKPHANAGGALHVKDLARRAGVTPATVRYYARIGLLNPGREADNGYRRFTGDDLRRVVFVRKAQALGLTIADVREVLDAPREAGAPCQRVAARVRERLDEVRVRVEELRCAERRMAAALAKWESRNATQRAELCPLIEGVELDPAVPGNVLHVVGSSPGR